MADKKISALTGATTPLAGTEVLPIVQGGNTVKVAVSDLTTGRSVSAASLSLTTTPLAATSGGTGQSGYAVGDLLYASTTTALSKLADVATGNALISGGVGVAPSWGKIGLTTHVSGTLATGNGGTGLTSFTANGVVYASSTSALTTGSALGFDGTNLGVGVAPTSGFPLNVQATTARIGLTSTTGTNLVEQRIINTGGTRYIGNDSSGGSLTGVAYAAYDWYSGNYPMIFATNNTARMRITEGGEVYIAGTTDQGAYNLQVNGTGVWGAGVYVNGSDARLKEDVQPLADALEIVKSLNPVTFRYKPEYSKDQNVQPGFIAQELQAALANTNYVNGVVQAGPEYLNVAYQTLIPVLTKAIQQLESELNALKASINS